MKSDMDEIARRIRSLTLASTNASSFRTTNIYPSSVELHHGNSHNLPKNITKGPYDNLDQYLDTHFRLLREDFLKPIREDLAKFLRNPDEKLFNIKIHKVQFIRPGVKNEDVDCYCLEVLEGLTDKCWINMKNSKRFMTGCLLIFSEDNFQTIFCGRVVDSEKLIYRNMLVSFERPRALKLKKHYRMIECNAFFEPYYHVLKAIQNINNLNFPMQKYLIEANTSVEMPKYLCGIKRVVVDPRLNKSQLSAINAALSQELVIIQGPPGTGKTFLGLKIAKELMKMSSLWYHKSPMLIISATNHALDQFLEGLSDCTEDMLRCGSQSKNSKMENYSLSNCRQRFYSTVNGFPMKKKIGNVYMDYRSIVDNITDVANQIDCIATTQPNLIFFFDKLVNVNGDCIRTFFNKKNRGDMVSWLLEEDGTMGEVRSAPVLSKSDQRTLMAHCYKTYLSFKPSRYCMLSISIMKNAITKLHDTITKIKNEIDILEKVEPVTLGHRTTEKQKKEDFTRLTGNYIYLLHKHEYLKHCLTHSLKSTDVEWKKVSTDLFAIPVRVRWQLYQYWLKQHEEHLRWKMDKLIAEYKPMAEEFHILEAQNTLAVMRHQKIIGMTTTLAARMHSVIKSLKCPIVIVEEAAEVLEAHVIPVLTAHCEHLILIGDHKQLKPSTADYTIETHYKLGVSLFERMVENNMQCHTLNVQHRMRPEISCLITPSIYPELNNHDSVHKFPKIEGIEKSIFFISHSNAEKSAGDTSKKNTHEAKFLIRLAVYLLQIGYKPEHITILAAYLGQVGALTQEQNENPNDQVKKVMITSVDNFQGEENRIILLSLVRNNDSKAIGFLSTENRVCVALSRAKEGLYVMGNMSQLSESSALWRKINAKLVAQKAVGTALPLQCTIHGSLTLVRTSEDFDQRPPNRGCGKLCDLKLKCGHVCQEPCHYDDFKHLNYHCVCSRKGNRFHYVKMMRKMSYSNGTITRRES